MPLTHADGQLLFIIVCYYILFYTKSACLTARVWPFSMHFNDNNFGCSTKKCTRAGGGKLLYYKSWPYVGCIMHQCIDPLQPMSFRVTRSCDHRHLGVPSGRVSTRKCIRLIFSCMLFVRESLTCLHPVKIYSMFSRGGSMIFRMVGL